MPAMALSLTLSLVKTVIEGRRLLLPGLVVERRSEVVNRSHRA